MTSNRLGQVSSFGVFLIGMVYLLALAVGFTKYGLSAPIVDPLLAIMEILTLSSTPLLLVMMAAVYGRAPGESKTMGMIGFACMTLAMGMTSAVHFVELTAMRQLGSTHLVWPSPTYALELLAWDGLLGMALLFAAFTFADSGRERRVRRSLLVCGSLCLLGIVGPMVGNMRLQLVGVFGYGGVLPFACLLLAQLFRATKVEPATRVQDRLTEV